MFVCKKSKTAVLNSADLSGEIICPECSKVITLKQDGEAAKNELQQGAALFTAMYELIPSGYAVFYGPYHAKTRIKADWIISGMMQPGKGNRLARLLTFAFLRVKGLKRWKSFSHYH